jgi:hypothetical protein
MAIWLPNLKLFLQVFQMFGGLALCSLEAVVAKDGKKYIIEVNECAMGLLGESQYLLPIFTLTS